MAVWGDRDEARIGEATNLGCQRASRSGRDPVVSRRAIRARAAPVDKAAATPFLLVSMRLDIRSPCGARNRKAQPAIREVAGAPPSFDPSVRPPPAAHSFDHKGKTCRLGPLCQAVVHTEMARATRPPRRLAVRTRFCFRLKGALSSPSSWRPLRTTRERRELRVQAPASVRAKRERRGAPAVVMVVAQNWRPALARHHRGAAGADGGDDLFGVDALEADRGRAEVAWPESALDDVGRDTLAGALEPCALAPLMRREARSDACARGEPAGAALCSLGRDGRPPDAG